MLASVAVDFTSCRAVGADADGGGRSILWLPMARQRRRETSEQAPPACEVAKKAVGGHRRGSPGVRERQGALQGGAGRQGNRSIRGRQGESRASGAQWSLAGVRGPRASDDRDAPPVIHIFRYTYQAWHVLYWHKLGRYVPYLSYRKANMTSSGENDVVTQSMGTISDCFCPQVNMV